MSAILPNTVPELIQMLDTKYPNRTIQPGQTELEAHRYAGSREVVDFLITALRLTEKKQLENIEGVI
jgi:hypothetical protein